MVSWSGLMVYTCTLGLIFFNIRTSRRCICRQCFPIWIQVLSLTTIIGFRVMGPPYPHLIQGMLNAHNFAQLGRFFIICLENFKKSQVIIVKISWWILPWLKRIIQLWINQLNITWNVYASLKGRSYCMKNFDYSKWLVLISLITFSYSDCQYRYDETG